MILHHRVLGQLPGSTARLRRDLRLSRATTAHPLAVNASPLSVREIAGHIEDKIADGLIDAKTIGATHVRLEVDGSVIRIVPISVAASTREDNDKR